MTTTPAPPPHSFRMPAEALADLYRGDLELIANLSEGWNIVLIWHDGATEEAERDADRLERCGVPVLWLREEQLHQLATGRPTELTVAGRRYLIVVDDVEQLDDLLEDEE